MVVGANCVRWGIFAMASTFALGKRENACLGEWNANQCSANIPGSTTRFNAKRDRGCEHHCCATVNSA